MIAKNELTKWFNGEVMVEIDKNSPGKIDFHEPVSIISPAIYDRFLEMVGVKASMPYGDDE